MSDQPRQPSTSVPPPLSLVLEQLACPACLAPLRNGGTHLACTGCARLYPITDGIPVLIAN